MLGSKQTHQWSELSGERLILHIGVVWLQEGEEGRRRRKALQNSVVKYSIH